MTSSTSPLVPVHARLAEGAPFDFGTHANDFLLRREQALATETFTVRVPGGGAVPPHIHTDMEQTFVFVSGVGEATLSCEGDIRTFTCRPGDMLFVPTGWHHTVRTDNLEGCVYVTVNAFVSEAERIGDSALEHAEIALDGFRSRDASTSAESGPDAVAMLRCAEAAFRIDGNGVRMWPQDFSAPDATLTREPGTYRVRRIGPFEYVTTVTPVPRILDAALADRLHEAASGLVPVYVEGSQSPLSVKPPCATSDLDILLVVENSEDVEAARKAIETLRGLQDEVAVPLSAGVVHVEWLGLPNLYSALPLDPASPDRSWWTATDEQCRAEAARRQREGLQLLRHPQHLREVLDRSKALLDAHASAASVDEWRITPRWIGYV
ncbi:cupin domain-containing protein [Streptomyces sp. NPDC054933]